MSRFERWQNRLQVFERKYLPINRYLFLVILCSFVAGGASYYQYFNILPVPQKKSKQVTQLEQKLNTQAQELAQRNLELNIAHEANNNMKQMFTEQQAKQADIERELAFYRSIMAPETSAQGISIYDLRLDKSLIDGEFELNLILTQLKKRRSLLKGNAELTLIGVKNGKEVKQSINKLLNEKFEFNFRFFQTIETKLLFPKGVDWKKILVKVKVPASRWVKAEETERSFDIDKLLEPESDLVIENTNT